MGYESRLYIVNKSNIRDDDNRRYAQVIAVFNLAKVNEISNIMTRFKNTDAYIYSDDGNTRIIEDEYGKPLTEMSIDDAIKILESVDSDYRRYVPCLAMLKGFDQSQWKDLVVLHYGY